MVTKYALLKQSSSYYNKIQKYIKCLKHSYGMSTPRQNNPNSNPYFNNHLVPIMTNDTAVAAITTAPMQVSNKRIQG